MARKNESTENIEFPNQHIVNINLEQEVRQSFIEYSMSVIIARALPDVRDGLKPVHRRILYAMYEDHLTYDKPFRKSATTVGNVLGRYHPHGDTAVYDSMVRLAQPFSLRYPLIEGHGNFGNVDGDGAAAYRYTEARMSKIADSMLSDIDKDVIDYTPNFDNRLKEPVVLPSRFPNLLVNGSVGIAVGMATNIPPHNLGEVIDGTIYLMEHPDATVPELMQYIKGPDFPTYATIYGVKGIVEAYTTGHGRVMVRSKAEVDEENHRIIISEIPYMVNKSLLVRSIVDLHKDKRVEGITEIRDESGRAGMRIVIEYRRDTNGQVLLNQLYRNTQLQDTCAINMLAIVNGEPKVLGLKPILQHYIAHQEDVVTRRVKYDLAKAEHEAHIFEGYKIAIDNIERVIEIIRGSESIQAAKENLMAEFALSDEQAQAIVDMTLGKLTGMERDKIEERIAKLHALIAELKGILADETKLLEIIKNDMLEIRRKYADPRRTEIVEVEDEIFDEDLIERHTCVITMTHAGYIKRQPSSTYTSQNRGGKGIIAMATKESDFIENVSISGSHSYLMFFTNTGRVYTKKAYQIPEAGRTAKGTNIVNILELQPDEKITAEISVETLQGENDYLLMVTKRGVIKRTLLSEFAYQRKSGKKAVVLDEGDELVFVRHTHGGEEILIATHEGNAVRFCEDEARVMGRGARGVRGIKLSAEDYVVGVSVVDETKKLLTVTENGYGKLTSYEDFRVMKHRGGSGVCCQKITDKTGHLCSIATVDETDDIMMITDAGIIIRTPVSGVSEYSRTAAGVILMRLTEGATLVNVVRLEKEPDEEEIEQAEETIANAPVDNEEWPDEDENETGDADSEEAGEPAEEGETDAEDEDTDETEEDGDDTDL